MLLQAREFAERPVFADTGSGYLGPMLGRRSSHIHGYVQRHPSEQFAGAVTA